MHNTVLYALMIFMATAKTQYTLMEQSNISIKAVSLKCVTPLEQTDIVVKLYPVLPQAIENHEMNPSST